MATPDLDGGYDPQDTAEAFDETHNVDEMNLSDETRSFEPDLFEDVFDATRADGDADEDDALDAGEYDPDELSLDDEEDDQGLLYLDDDLDDDLALDQQRLHPGPVPTALGEAEVTYVDDIDDADGGGRPHDRLARRYESTGELSDGDLNELGYSTKDGSSMTEHPKPKDDEDIKGSGASAEDVPEENDADEEERLDEGLEETFPASDPVSAKHIT